jgi:hypothetical protein
MNERFFTRTDLESLTTGELAALAERYGLDIPSGLDRLFIIGELRELAQADEAEGPEGTPETWAGEGGFLEPALLPKQYNITFVKVMIRDPLWAFVFWEVKGFDKEAFEKAPDFGGYYLKVCPWKEGDGNSQSEGEGVFTVPVETGDTARYLGLPPAGEEGEGGEDNRFRVQLCAKRGGEEFVLALSNPFRLPSLPALPAGTEQGEGGTRYGNPLIRLSGSGEFHILHNRDRLYRSKKG